MPSVDKTPAAPLAGDGRPPRRSVLACTRCRQQKMKCSGGPVPPCDRCRKASSPCIFEPPSHQQHQPHPFASYQPRSPYQSLHARPIPPNPYPDPPRVHPVGAYVGRDTPPAPGLSPQQTPPHDTSVTMTAASCCSAPAFDTAIQPSSRTDSANTERPPPSPPVSTEFPARKRRRTCSVTESGDYPTDTLPSEALADPDSSSAASSPYQVVRDFEVAHRRPAAVTDADSHSGNTAPSCASQAGLTGENIFTRNLKGRQVLARCLAAVDLSYTDARDMFALFGDRVAPFIPWLYDYDFTDLPDDPLLALSCIHVMARYLPGVSRLRYRLEAVLISLLQQVTFDDLGRPYEAVLETFKGLGVVYGYAEVGVASPVDDIARPKLDTLSVKGIVEGYAVRWNIGKAHPSNAMGCTLWLWLYTTGNYYSILLGCPRTLSAGPYLHKAREIVARYRLNSQVSVLLGEVDLCLASEQNNPPRPLTPFGEDPSQSHHEWERIISSLDTTATAEGRRLRFHCHFAKFYRASSQHTRSHVPVTSEALEMTQSFLHCVTKSSPVSKGRLKYMPDFGFVMLVFACCFILRYPAEAMSRHREDGQGFLTRAAVIQDVQDVADLLTSLSSKQDSVSAAYGRALRGACISSRAPPSPNSTASGMEPRNGRASATSRRTSHTTGLDVIQHGGGGGMRGPILTDEGAEGMVYGTLGPGQEDVQGFYGQMDADQSVPGARAEDDIPTPWYGTCIDTPSGLLLDALSVPWQFG
ncbi:uncharacterized protein DNG_08888 [Cephalotrichum gorgonifer]|uniref:Zn(2)-C6 fungal-type domain-containing protein n=1 Tax=Cephalotrichum gorgonifer TaxID=2041049 RepID=A0AAE8N6B6_9PEZI|nr:uncharacterized protein DNG_08888 [Cephalotrichum gorgonifer]